MEPQDRFEVLSLTYALERENESLRRTLYIHRMIDGFAAILLVISLTLFIAFHL